MKVFVNTKKDGIRLCHNCDTKPVLAAKIDYTDEAGLLILRNL